MLDNTQIIIGVFYELSNGEIIYVYGKSITSTTAIFCYYAVDGNAKTVVAAETRNWKERRDLRDFPNTTDPKLPYDFDLYWDIKRISDLKRELVGHRFEKQIRQAMVTHGIVLKGNKYKEVVPDSKCYLLSLLPGEEPCIACGPFKSANAWIEAVKFFKETDNKIEGRLLLLEVFAEGLPCVTEYTKEDCDKLLDVAIDTDVGV